MEIAASFVCTAAVALTSPGANDATPVAVFNFQLTTADKTPDWVWLEKFLSDQITTDFHHDGKLSVIARDRMQLMAEELKWVPEMATSDPDSMKRIRAGLKIEYLVSGVCSVAEGRLEIIAQVVGVKTRKEVYRSKVAGKTEDVLTLQKKLSADLLSWFTKRPVGLILPNLPVWTRSLPAVRALYEGMDLYDQGRYGEAWLKFRQASREDPAYVEAVYWVGKMYYFTHRYRHARRTFDRFVYLDIAHPRMTDCLTEYIHTYEALGESPERLLELYGRCLQRISGRPRPSARTLFRGSAQEKWTSERYVETLVRLGRHGEAVRCAA